MKLFINGQWIDSNSGEVYTVINPATGDIVDTVSMGDIKEADMAIEAASIAYKNWSKTSLSSRARILNKAAGLIREHRDELATLLTQEQGKPLRESRYEIAGFARVCEYYAWMADKMREHLVHLSQENRHGFIAKYPIGVCGIILPWNFPVGIMGWKIAPALMAGNTIIVKPAETTPLTNLRCAEIFERAGLPNGVLNVVTGYGDIVGEAIVRSPLVRKISFTGETVTGKRIMETASADLKKLTLELGGSDAMIVCNDADLDFAVEGALRGRFVNCGQICNAVKRLYLCEDIAEEFTRKLVARVQQIKVGNGLDPDTIMGPLNNSEQRERVEKQVADAVSAGAKVLTGGSRPSGPNYEAGFFYLPTLLANVSQNSAIVNEECFGPVLPIFTVAHLDEGLEKANNSRYGLGASVWTRDLRNAMKAVEVLEAGTVWVNTCTESSFEMPFGGVKQSGLGRELGYEGLEEYLETKAVQINLSDKKEPWFT